MSIIQDFFTPANIPAPIPLGVSDNMANLKGRSYSGCDIRAVVQNKGVAPVTIGNIQTLSYSIHREVFPVRAMGFTNLKGKTHGPRCLPETEKVLTRDKGYLSIKDILPGDYVQSLPNIYNKVVGSYNQGLKDCYHLKLSNGYDLRASYDHPISTPSGWKNMRDLEIGDLVNVAAVSPSTEIDYEIDDKILKLLAYLLGDGTTQKYLKSNNKSYEYRIGLSISDKEIDSIGAETELILNELNIPFKDYRKNDDKCITRRISVCLKGYAQTSYKLRKYNVLHEALLKYDMYGKYSYEKILPSEFISFLSKRQIALFLSRLYSTDGCYAISGNTKDISAKFCSTSENLIDGIRLLLSKLHISAIKQIEYKVGKQGGRPNIISRHDAYHLIISNALNLKKFIEDIGIFSKDQLVNEFIPAIKVRADLGRTKNNHMFAEQKVIANTHIGFLPVYDLEIEDNHSFIANFIHVHNTIAGTMIFSVFDRYALYDIAKFKAKTDHLPGDNPMHMLGDQMTPFDISVLFQNELGDISKLAIIGISLVDEGQVMSVNDIYIESTHSFIADDVIPMYPITNGPMTESSWALVDTAYSFDANTGIVVNNGTFANL